MENIETKTETPSLREVGSGRYQTMVMCGGCKTVYDRKITKQSYVPKGFNKKNGTSHPEYETEGLLIKLSCGTLYGLSHSLGKDCAEKLYPDMEFKNGKGENQEFCIKHHS